MFGAKYIFEPLKLVHRLPLMLGGNVIQLNCNKKKQICFASNRQSFKCYSPDMHVDYQTLYGTVQVCRTRVFGRRKFLGALACPQFYVCLLSLGTNIGPVRQRNSLGFSQTLSRGTNNIQLISIHELKCTLKYTRQNLSFQN